MHYIYMDSAATTPVYPEVADYMAQILRENYGNPSSLYKPGREARALIEASREKIASYIGAKPNELYFTGGGSESVNWALKGACRANASRKGRHIVASAFEHHATLHALQALEKEGFEVTWLAVHEEGVVRPDELAASLRPDTCLVCIMSVNNEIGTIQPVMECASLTKANGSLFFTDATAAMGHIPVSVGKDVDLLAFSGHKFGAAKGVGALFIRNGTRVENLIEGGGHERGRRGGTENTASIAGMALALELSQKKMEGSGRVRALRDKMLASILKIPHTRLNGSAESRVFNNINVSFDFIEGESLILLLDMAGIATSTGSACSSASLDPSHVLLALGLPHETAHGSLRLTLLYDAAEEEADYVVEKLPRIVQRLRDMSPLYDKS